MTLAQRKRQDISAFAALIRTPGVLATGFNLPANAECYIGTSSVLAATTVLLDAGVRALGAPASAANVAHSVGRLSRGVHVAKHSGAPGTVSLYVRNGAGKLFKIGG